MKYYTVLRRYGEPIPMPTLEPGMCLATYTDKGPSGPCGQGMSTTCPHASILIFPDYDTMKAEMGKRGMRNGQRADFRVFVVDEYGDGQLTIGLHDTLIED